MLCMHASHLDYVYGWLVASVSRQNADETVQSP